MGHLKIIPDYIATSLLCCAHCKLVMDSYGYGNETISGTHARAYSKWVLPSIFKNNTDFLKTFLGDELYEKYMELTTKTTLFNRKEVVKSELALRILENIASIDDEYLSKIGIMAERLWNEERMFPDESDDENFDEVETSKNLVADKNELPISGESSFLEGAFSE